MNKDRQYKGSVTPKSTTIFIVAMLLSVAIPIFMGGLLSWHSLGELDVWLHQKAGQDILKNQELLHHNTYSYIEPNHPWTNHEWLFQLLVAKTGPGQDDLDAGINRWIILRLLLTLLLLLVLLLGDRPWRAPPLKLYWLAPGIFLGVALLWTRILLRPELLSYALIIALIRLAELSPKEPWSLRNLFSPKSREFLAFIATLFWAQIHGFSTLAPVIWLLAGLWGYVPHSRFPRTSVPRLAAGTLLLLTALMMTPNGWQGFIYPIKALGQFSAATVDMSSTISELQPLLSTPNGLGFTLLAFKISLVWGLLHIILTWPGRNVLRITLWLLAAAAAVLAQRNIGLYAITFVMLHTNAVSFQKLSFFPGKGKIRPIFALVPTLLLLVAAAWFWPAVVKDDFYLAEGQSRRFGSGPTVARFPFQAMQMLARAPETQIFANVDGAALSLSRGQAKVFIDGRTEAYSPQTWELYRKLRQAGPEALNILDQTNTRNILLTLGGNAFHPLLRTLLQDNQWTVRQADPAGVLLSRAEQSSIRPQGNPLTSFALAQPLSPQGDFSITRQADWLGALATLHQLAGNASQGEATLRRGLTLRPNHPLLNHNLGNLLMSKGQPALALAHFEQALDKNSRLAGSALNAGVCLMQTGKFKEAQQMFLKSTQLQPDNYQAWVNLSLALQQLNHQPDALGAMKKAVDLNPDNQRLRKALQDMDSQY